jgi:serine/threonine-protein kinase
MMGAAGYALSTTNIGRDDASTAPGDQVLVQQGPRKCIVTYSVRSDTGKTFQAGLTVTNLTGVPVSDWVLRFVMPGDQTVSTIGKLKPRQEQHDVAVRSTKPIRPNSTAVMDVTGGYRTSNEVPVAFSLKGETCDVFVSGKPGEPSRPVQRLVGGGTRLGPVPPAGVVLPGLTASPGGVIETIPVTPTGTAGPASPTRTSPPAPRPPDLPVSPSTTASNTPPPSPPPNLPDTGTTTPAPEVTATETAVDDGGGVVIVPPAPLP